MSDRLREAARQALLQGKKGLQPKSVAELRSFLARYQERESGRQPDWTEHRRIIDESSA